MNRFNPKVDFYFKYIAFLCAEYLIGYLIDLELWQKRIW